MKFWIFWGFDALMASVVLYFFTVGLYDGSVSGFNIGLWLGLLLVTGFVMVGSLVFRSKGWRGAAFGVLLTFAIPGLLCALFFLVVLITNPRWN